MDWIVIFGIIITTSIIFMIILVINIIIIIILFNYIECLLKMRKIAALTPARDVENCYAGSG